MPFSFNQDLHLLRSSNFHNEQALLGKSRSALAIRGAAKYHLLKNNNLVNKILILISIFHLRRKQVARKDF